MTVPMVGPGPLEGGPMGSPGPAKSGESFSAHLKQAFEQPKGTGPAPSPKIAETSSSPAPSENKTEAETRDGASPPSLPQKLPSPVVEKDIPVSPAFNDSPAVSDEGRGGGPVLLENNPLVISPCPVDLSSEGENPPTETGKTQEFDQVMMAVVPLEGLVEPVVDSTAGVEEIPSDSDAENQEPMKDKSAPVALPAPLPIPLTVILPTPVQEDSVQGGTVKEMAAGSVNPVSLKDKVLPLPASTPLPEKEAKESDIKPESAQPNMANVVAEKSKKDKPSPSVVELNPKDENVAPTPTQTPTPPFGPLKKGITTSPLTKEQGDQKGGGKNETPSPQPMSLPQSIVQPEGTSPEPFSTEVLDKLKEITSIAPLRSSSPDHGAEMGAEISQSALPPTVHSGAPADSARPSAPAVVAPSPVDLARQIHVHLESGQSVVRIDLHPDHLGELRISMETKGKDVSMRFTVDNDAARTAVVAGLREITGTLSTLGWNVSGLAVQVSAGGPGNGRGDSNGPLWSQGAKPSNELPVETVVPASKGGPGGWRVDLVA